MGFSITPQELGDILAEEDLAGFTRFLRFPERRYVVAFTINKERTLDLLVAQLEYYSQFYDSITIGGRTDDEDGHVEIDPGTSLDDLDEALDLGRRYHQQSIYDRETEECIPCS